jgi:hypothetical protein
MWETRNTNDGGRGNIKEHKGTRDYFIPGLGGQAAASLLAAAFASPSCIHVERGEGWGVSTGQIRGEQLESHSRHPGHKAHRDRSLELWRLLRVSDSVRVQAMGREERRRRSAARRPGSGWVGPLECQESTGCPLPSIGNSAANSKWKVWAACTQFAQRRERRFFAPSFPPKLGKELEFGSEARHVPIAARNALLNWTATQSVV